jgi:hypothetical protein
MPLGNIVLARVKPQAHDPVDFLNRLRLLLRQFNRLKLKIHLTILGQIHLPDRQKCAVPIYRLDGHTLIVPDNRPPLQSCAITRSNRGEGQNIGQSPISGIPNLTLAVRFTDRLSHLAILNLLPFVSKKARQ